MGKYLEGFVVNELNITWTRLSNRYYLKDNNLKTVFPTEALGTGKVKKSLALGAKNYGTQHLPYGSSWSSLLDLFSIQMTL